MKNIISSKILNVVCVVLWVLLIVTNQYLRGVIFVLICICSWIKVKIDPNGRIQALSRSGFWSEISKTTFAIILSASAILYWIVFLLIKKNEAKTGAVVELDVIFNYLNQILTAVELAS